VPPLADRLRTLAEIWHEASKAGFARPTPTSALEELRTALNALAEDAAATLHGDLAGALRRIALLSEVWECLESEPGQSEAATDLADFCLGAILELARDAQGSPESSEIAVCDRILHQSGERWSDYLSLVDPSSTTPPSPDASSSFDEADIPQDDEPPALDPQTLLGLLNRFGNDGRRPAPGAELSAHKPSEARQLGTSAEAESLRRAPAQPEASACASSVESPAREEPVRTGAEAGLVIPPLPGQFDLDAEMREAFLADAGELFERIETIVVGLGSQADARRQIQELGRCLHTLKGAAGSVGLSDLATLVHGVEERLEHAVGHVSPGLNDLLYQVVGYLEELLRLLPGGPPASHGGGLQPPDLGTDAIPLSTTRASDLSASEPPAMGEATSALPIPTADVGTQEISLAGCDRPEALRPPPQERADPSLAESAAPAQPSGAEGPIRVPPARFDELLDLASELIMQGRFWLAQADSMERFAATVQGCRNRLLGSLDRLSDVGPEQKGRSDSGIRSALGDLPAQLRHLAEQADDLAVLGRSAQAAAAPIAQRGDTLARLSLQLWISFQALRIVPIRGLFQRLARVAHDAARVEGRQVEVAMVGEETSLDRGIQDKAFEPLLHVVRNAVGHGIESPADRLRAGKNPAGRVTLEASREGNTLIIAVEDDGSGLDEDAIARKARQLGWLGADEAPSREQLHAFLFRPGFSTKAQANAISGRGVGMDVVASQVGRLRGTVELASRPGRGTRLALRLPARLALEPALIVRVGGQPLALPASQVEHAQSFEPPAARAGAPEDGNSRDSGSTAVDDAVVTYRDQAVPVISAHEMLGIGRASPAVWPKLVLVRAESRLIGLVVDAIEGAQDLVIKPLGALLAGHPLVSGTSLSIDGEVISVLNASGLEEWLKIRKAPGRAPARSRPAPERGAAHAKEEMAVLVVDDSISVRRAVARQLSGLGLGVHEASDGLEALGRLRTFRYALVLTDLEMPKLDGFALLAEMKQSATLATVPVIVASTRDDPKTRERVLDLGATALLSKPVDPLELARIVEPVLPGARN
jgi:chemotaxis protein histidine kinase CheA